MFDTSQQMEVFPTTVDLKRIDPSLNMRRFYRMSVQPDLFGGACLVREWGRIGFRGQMLVEEHDDDDEGRAVNALMKLLATKKRWRYRLSIRRERRRDRRQRYCERNPQQEGPGPPQVETDIAGERPKVSRPPEGQTCLRTPEGSDGPRYPDHRPGLRQGHDHDGQHGLQHGPIAVASQPRCARLTPKSTKAPLKPKCRGCDGISSIAGETTGSRAAYRRCPTVCRANVH